MNRSSYIKEKLFKLESQAWESYNSLLNSQKEILKLMEEIQELKNIIT